MYLDGNFDYQNEAWESERVGRISQETTPNS